jgi:hypothetical protein
VLLILRNVYVKETTMKVCLKNYHCKKEMKEGKQSGKNK